MEMYTQMTPKQEDLKRFEALRSERASYDSTWRDVADHITPRRVRFDHGDEERGDRQDQEIVNSTATRAHRIARSGMMAGMTSPARKWFRLVTPDPDMLDYGPVREWLWVAEQRILLLAARSNVYHMLSEMYADILEFGPSAAIVAEDLDDVIRGYTVPIGSYCLATNATRRVDTLYRELRMTARQMAGKFGMERLSTQVRSAIQQGTPDTKFEVIHVVKPNTEQDPAYADWRGMPYIGRWYEKAGEPDAILETRGYHESPLLAPRWDVTGEDVYGTAPGVEALGDIRALQHMERRASQLYDLLVRPPWNVPISMKNSGIARLIPGGKNYVGQGDKIEPAIKVDPKGLYIKDEILRHEDRINAGFFADLFLMLARSDNPQMTAREIEERHEEKMLQLGPVLERLHDELLDPLIDRMFGVLLRAGHIPPPPRELEGQVLRVEYTSILAQAQKLIGLVGVERLGGFVGQLAGMDPSALDKFDIDAAIDEYGDLVGTPPHLIRPAEQVQAIRAQRQAAAQAAQAAEVAKSAGQAAQSLSQTDLERDNALSRLLRATGAAA